MKIPQLITLIKTFKFLNFRKYISVNFIIITFFVFLILNLIHTITDYPPPVTIYDWGEPYNKVSPQEENILNQILCSFFLIWGLSILFPFELLIRAVIEFLYKKFFPEKIINKPSKLKFKIPKFISIIYSIIIYVSALIAIIIAGLILISPP